MIFWTIIGVLILLWVGYDVYTGTVWVHRELSRASEPILYWFWITVYSFLGLSCFISY